MVTVKHSNEALILFISQAFNHLLKLNKNTNVCCCKICINFNHTKLPDNWERSSEFSFLLLLDW